MILCSFDVMGSVDTQYMDAQETDREKRNAIGLYQQSGMSQYSESISGSSGAATNNSGRGNNGNGNSNGNSGRSHGNSGMGNGTSVRYTDGTAFPANWDPRYTLYQGVSAFPDHREDYRVNKDGPRQPTVNLTEEEDFTANPEDAPTGFLINGNLPTDAEVGVHSLTDVPVFAMGPCQEYFGGKSNAASPKKSCQAPPSSRLTMESILQVYTTTPRSSSRWPSVWVSRARATRPSPRTKVKGSTTQASDRSWIALQQQQQQ